MKLWKKKWPWIVGGCILLAVLVILLVRDQPQDALAPTLTVGTPQKLSASTTEEFVVDVTVNQLGESLYPAMSMSIDFDPAKLEFLGIEEGNVFVFSNENSTGRQLPRWNCNVQSCNASGKINVMYLDMTGGRNAFSQLLLEESDNVVLRLRFRLRGSVRAGDVMDLVVEDAVFAASDETESLAMTMDTLKVRNGKIVIGE